MNAVVTTMENMLVNAAFSQLLLNTVLTVNTDVGNPIRRVPINAYCSNGAQQIRITVNATRIVTLASNDIGNVTCSILANFEPMRNAMAKPPMTKTHKPMDVTMPSSTKAVCLFC